MKELNEFEIEAVSGADAFGAATAGFGGSGSGAALGAGIGSFAGPFGALTGGLIGGFMGTVGGTYVYLKMR